MNIKPRKTKAPFSWIMEITFWLSKWIKNKPNNKIVATDPSVWPQSDDELWNFFRQWKYSHDPGHGLINMVAHPDIAKQLVVGDCDDYAAKLYALAPFEEKYLLTYFTHDLKKWHTVFVWYNNQTGRFSVINWGSRYSANHFYQIIYILKDDSKSEWYDYHLSYFDKTKNKWMSHK